MSSGKLAGLWCMPKADKYGRDICTVVLQNQEGKKFDPAEELLKEGLAEVEYARFLPPGLEGNYRAAEAKAQREKIGIWSQGKKYVKPWEWRHKKAKAKNASENTNNLFQLSPLKLNRVKHLKLTFL